MTADQFLHRLARRRHGDHFAERLTVRCTECDSYELSVRYSGDPDAGFVGDPIAEDADLSTCPVCGAETEVCVT